MKRTEPEIVERPIGRAARSGHKYPYAEIMASAETGKAVKFSLNGSSAQTVASAISRTLALRGLRSHAHNPKDGTLIVWAEKVTP